jgi:hypothetical protein
MRKPIEPKLVEIFAGTPWETGLVSSLLEDSNIQAYIADGIMGSMNPWWTAPGGMGAVRVMVSSEDAETAQHIIAEYMKNQNS